MKGISRYKERHPVPHQYSAETRGCERACRAGLRGEYDEHTRSFMRRYPDMAAVAGEAARRYGATRDHVELMEPTAPWDVGDA